LAGALWADQVVALIRLLGDYRRFGIAPAIYQPNNYRPLESCHNYPYDRGNKLPGH